MSVTRIRIPALCRAILLLLTAVSAHGEPSLQDFYAAYRQAVEAPGIDAAIPAWEKALSLVSQDTPPQFTTAVRQNLAFLLHQKGTVHFQRIGIEPGAFERSVDLFNRAALADPGSEYVLEWIFHAAVREGNPGAGIEVLEALAAAYEQARQYHAGGKALELCGDLAGAEEAWSRALRLYGRADAILEMETGASGTSGAYRELADRRALVAAKTANALRLSGNLAGAVVLADTLVTGDTMSDDYLLWHDVFMVQRWAALEAFGNRDWAAALDHYRKAGQALGHNARLAGEHTPEEGWNYFERIIRKRMEMGTITPVAVHRVLSLFYLHTRTDKAPPQDISPIMINAARIHENALARIVEAFSGGLFTLSFEERLVGEPLSELVSWEYDGHTNASPDFRKVRESLGHDFWAEACASFDTVIEYWNGAGISVTATGGAFLPPYHPSIARGNILMPAHYMITTADPILLLHEIFHVFEVVGGIGPVHGYTPANRIGFPEWTGRGEIDYYRWHFAGTLSERGYDNLSFLKIYPVSERR